MKKVLCVLFIIALVMLIIFIWVGFIDKDIINFSLAFTISILCIGNILLTIKYFKEGK